MKTFQLAALLTVLPLVAWLWHEAVSKTTAPMQIALRALDDLSIAEGALLRDVLSARTGTLRNYDPLVREVAQLHEAVDRLRQSMTGDIEIQAAADRLATLIDRQDRQTEQFKTENALLQNSLAQFSFLSARLSDVHRRRPEGGAVSALAAAILQLTLDTSPSAVIEVDHRLTDLSARRFSPEGGNVVAAILRQARLLSILLPETDEAVKAITGTPAEPWQEPVRTLVLARAAAAEARTKRFRYALFGTSLLALGLLAYAGGRLRGHNRALKRRAAFEHVLAMLSTRLIDSRPHEIRKHVECALADLAVCLGAQRAYFTVPGEPESSYQWNQARAGVPRNWPEKAIIAASLLGARGSAILADDVAGLPSGPGREMLLAAGLRGWLYVERRAVRERKSCALGFDVLRRGQLPDASLASLLHMTLEAIANALNREYLEQERADLEASLQQARRMETIGAISSGIAHNFNNIVGAILGYTERAQAYAANDKRLPSTLGEIRRAGERGRDLVEQLLAFGRRRGIRATRLATDDLIAETISQLDATLPAFVRIAVHGIPSRVIVLGEAAQLQQVIVNLCNNAAQAMDSEGLISVRVEAREIARGVALKQGSLHPGRYALLSVADSGRGMNEETLEQLFEPFFTTRADGNGLGLATVREIVLEHGGAIDVHSAPAAGTCFEIWLPEASHASSLARQEVQRRTTRGNGETVLIIDADGERLRRHEELIAALGYEPVGFAEPAEAAAASKEDPTRFDLALLCGPAQGPNAVLERVRSLRASAPHLPIIIASPSTADFSAPALADLGIAELIHQPLSSAEVASALARCLLKVTHMSDIYYDRSHSPNSEAQM
ncbi:MAG: two-component system VirA-like sensor kinase [Gammaproteobacteria bacterium]